MLRIGLMGCGSVADFGHIPAILDTDGLQLAALFDPNRVQLERLASKFEVPHAFVDQREFLEQKLDAVVVASPVGAHLENAVAAAKAGAHVLCEKPLSVDEESSVELARLVRAEDRMLFTAFVYRFSHVSQQIRQWIADGIVGDVRALRLIYHWNLHGRYEQDSEGKWIESPRWRGRMLEGGPLVDCGVHFIDLARWWLKSEVVQSVSSGAWVAEYEAPDQVFLSMQHANGAHTSIEVSFTYGHTAREPLSLFSYHLSGTGGTIRYDREGYVLEARHGQGTIRSEGASEKNFHGMYAALKHALESGDVGDLASPEDGIIATRIATEATDAAIALRNNITVQKTKQIG